ncbi:MAG: hypothetical protein JST04_16710 [Bdellovibrionales bacterium]|nr:hypothetical protein [Bdellovibrionales bacterium]
MKFRHRNDDETGVKNLTRFARKYLVVKPLRKLAKVSTCLGISLCCASSCGILGNKKEANRSLAQGGACLDELGPISNQFLDGTVNEGQWRATWDCVDDTIDLFKKFVKGSETEGYLPSDLQFLMQKFMFSKGTVTAKLVDGALSMKASLFGGTEKRLSKDELESFRSLARFLKEETSALIPHLRNRHTNPTAANLRSLSVAIETFGNHLADYLNTGGHQKLTIDQAVEFTTELAKIAFTTDPATVEAWTRLGQEVKTLLVRGASDGVDGADWTKILKYGAKAAGAMVAYFDAPADDPMFEIEMINKLQTVLNSSVSDWGGELPFSQIEKIIDKAPNSILPELADDFRAGAKALFHPRVETVDGKTTTYRAAAARLFQTRTDTGIDAAAIERVVANYRLGRRANMHLTNIFAGTKEDLLPADFETRARAYMATLTNAADKNDVVRLITAANRYPGLHPANTPEILFLDQSKHSQNNLNRMSWYEIASTLLLQSYGSTSDSFGKAATLDDLNTLIADLKGFLYAFHMYHPLKTGIGAKRFREANLFMPNGNGDDKMNLPETSVYLAFIFSASRQNSRIMDLAVEGANPCPMKGWNVPLKLPIYEVQCFRDRFKANFAELFSNMPLLRDEIAAMSPADQATWNQTLEYASKTTGYNEDPITSFDVSSYAGLPHYAESVMLRFDTNHDGALDRRETLDNVFPIFKRELATLSKIKIDFVNQAVLLYLMQYGKQPDVWDLIGWALGAEYNKEFKARRIRIYQIFAALSPPAPADPISQTPPPGIYPPPPGSLPLASNASTSSLFANSPLGMITKGLVMGLTPVVTPATAVKPQGNFDLNAVDPTQLEGYDSSGPVIDPASPYQEALEVLPQDL